ncbi:hypothetical protein OEZ85_005292 [Tetradesmus obliquus]|uniref:Kinesin motor domain-containing protein n=1 Tax=Tetradesmus obliquus TaxID=3088 RepID=A0ABY8UHE4_TETOB|nr:hypothetical protein OEZ85_005292 [Tetradesmus obliquus]
MQRPEQLAGAEASTETLNSEKSELWARLAEEQQESARLDVEVEELTAKVAAQARVEAANQEVQARLRRQVANMTAAKSSLEASITHSSQLAAAVTSGALQLQSQLQRYADRAASLEVALRRAEDAVEAQTAELEECTEAWSSRETELLDEVASLTQQLAQQSELAQQAQQQLQQQGAALNEAQQDLEELRTQAAASEHELSSLTIEGQQLSQQLQEAQAQLQQQAQELAELRGVREQYAEAQEAAGDMQDRLQQLQQQVAELRAEAASRTPVGVSVEQAVSSLRRELEAAYSRLSTAEAEAGEARASAGRSATLALEMGRLQEDNAVLAERLEQMADDLKEMLGTGTNGLGHSNPRQKIQYHLKLKQELEELRHEATVLLRERFHLQQCIRYLAARSNDPLAADKGSMGGSKALAAKLQPASLAGNVLYTSPLSARSMSLSGRGKLADKGTVYTTREGFEEAISSVQRSTVDEMASWREPVEAAEAVTEAVQELRSSAVGIVAAARASSSGGGYRTAAADEDADAAFSAAGIVAAARASSGGGWRRVSAADAESDTAAAATAADAAPISENAAGDDADDDAAVAEEDPVPMTPAAAIRDVTFVTPRSSFSGGDQGPGQRRRVASSASKGRAGSLSASVQRWQDKQQQQPLFEKTPTPARNAVAGIEARILAKIAAVCSPAVGRRSVAVSSAGGATEDVPHGGKPAWKE